MTLEIFNCEQRSPEWVECRSGIPTASQFSTVLAKGRGGGESKTRRTYLLKLAGERLTGEPMDSYSNHHMERGRTMEEEARNAYAFMCDADPAPIGFIRNGDAGGSPDALLGDDGLLEIKTALPHLLVDILLKDKFPPEHWGQIQGQLWVSEREWCELVIYWPGLPLFVRRAPRDEDYIKGLSEEVARFNAEVTEVVNKIQQYGGQAGGDIDKPQARPPETIDMSNQPPVF